MGKEEAEVSMSNLESLPAKEISRLRRYGESLRGLCHCELVGAYVYGSAASGCWNPKTSDVDIVLVGHCMSDPEAVGELEHIHRQAKLPIDATVVAPEQLKVERLRAPVGFLIKPISKGKAIHCPEGSRDFVAQSQEVYERGIALFGPEPGDLFEPVPWPLVERYVYYVLPFISSRFKNPVLMLCRCAYTLALQKMGAKRESREWALAAMPSEWHSLIAEALVEYSGDDSVKPMSRNEVLQFDKYIAEWVANRR